jgi:hypothetical protein
MARKTLIQVRRDTAANWTSANPTLSAGEIGWESDTRKIKFGDGSTAWNSLSYETFGVTGGGGGATKLYDYEVTGSDKASIDTNVDGTTVANFSGYDVLEAYVIARTDDAGANAVGVMTLNNITTASYELVRMTTDGSGTFSGGAAVAASNMAFPIHGSGGGASYPSSVFLNFPDYAGTTFFKTINSIMATMDQTAVNNNADQRCYGFRSTSEITRIKFAASGTAKLKVGSRLLVYGKGGSAGASGLLAVFKQSAGTSQSTTSATQADVDATNAAITFTAPASGKVLIRVTCHAAMNAANQNAFLGLREGTTNIAGPTFATQGVAAASFDEVVSVCFYLTGVSAGSHTYKLAFSVNGGATFTIRQIGSVATIFPVTMEAWACP